MALRISSHFDTTIVIDGVIVPIKIARLNPQQAIAFRRDWDLVGQPTATAPEGETLEQKDAREAREWTLAFAARDVLVAAIASYITVEPGHIVDADNNDAPVTDGATLARLFGSRDDILQELFMDIAMENRMNSEQRAVRQSTLAPFVPTPVDIADRMIAIAEVTDRDLVIDPACGSARLCIAAAKRGARALGYDINDQRISEAAAAAKAEGVEHLCTFAKGDAQQVDFTQATVVPVYLLASGMAKMRPLWEAQLPAGARIVSHAFPMGHGWPADHAEYSPAPEPAPRTAAEDERYRALSDADKKADDEQRIAAVADTPQQRHIGARWIYLYSIDRWRAEHRAPRALQAVGA